MSLIPYAAGDERSVILRHQQTLVLYDPHSHQLVLREAAPSQQPFQPPFPPPSGTCPLCKRPLRPDGENGPVPEHGSPGLGRNRAQSPIAESGFVDQNYFRMLEDSVVEESATLKADGERVGDDKIDAGSFSPGYFERFFVTEKELGRGGKGVVLLVKHVLDGVSLGHFACKRVPVGDNHEWLEKVLLEVQLLQRLSHQNLVSYRHVWLEDVQLTSFGPSVPCAFILQQYCNAGDLHNYILKPAKKSTSAKEQLKDRMRRRSKGHPDTPELDRARKIPFEQIISFFRDIASGLNHLHSNGFIHRDLKPSNCLLHDTGIPGEDLRVLVSDFGEVQMTTSIRKSTGNTGTISYCAPEVLRRVSADSDEYGNFTTKSDVFSLGMILHFMCFGKLPYAGADALHEENEDLDSLREEITAWTGVLEPENTLRSDLPERLYQSLKTLISPDPSRRPDTEDILVGIKVGVGVDFEDPPASKHKRRGSASSNQKSADIATSQMMSFRRISPVADTPPPATPVETTPLVNRTTAFQDSTLSTPASASSSGGEIRNTKAKPPRSKLNTHLSPPPTPAAEVGEGSMILRPKPGPPAVPDLPSPFLPLRNWTPYLLVATKLAVFLGKVCQRCF